MNSQNLAPAAPPKGSELDGQSKLMVLFKPDLESAAHVDALALAIFTRACEHHQRGDIGQAYPLYLESVRLDPQIPEAWNNLAVILKFEKKPIAALVCARKAAALAPDSVPVCTNLANILWQNGALEEAKAVLDWVVAQDASVVLAWYDRANIAMLSGRLDDALHDIEKALALVPTLYDLLWTKAMIYLFQGQLEKGFHFYENRLQHTGYKLPQCPYPRWMGEDLSGKTIYIYGEQGLGDVIQFFRFLPLLAERAQRVIFESPKELRRLFESSLTTDNVLLRTHGESIPQADYHVSLVSLASKFPQDAWPTGNAYLKTPQNGPSLSKSKSGKLAVGICWAGSPVHELDRFRSTQLEDFVTVLSHPYIELFSLCITGRGEDPSLLGPMGIVTDLSPMIADFSDTAHLMSQMDCIVTVDTAVAHLAGALNLPCHLLLSHRGLDWRWQVNGEKTHWYESLRIYRQKPGEGFGPSLCQVFDRLLLQIE